MLVLFYGQLIIACEWQKANKMLVRLDSIMDVIIPLPLKNLITRFTSHIFIHKKNL